MLLPVGGRRKASPDRTFAATGANPFLLRTDLYGKASWIEPAKDQLNARRLERTAGRRRGGDRAVADRSIGQPHPRVTIPRLQIGTAKRPGRRRCVALPRVEHTGEDARAVEVGRSDQTAHPRVADAVLTGLEVAGVAVLQLRVGWDGDNEVVPAASPR
jgi:hypothetical protein